MVLMADVLDLEKEKKLLEDERKEIARFVKFLDSDGEEEVRA